MSKLRFYAKLAVQNIRTNRKFYIPYMLTGAGCALMLYIMTFLLFNNGLSGSFGGRTIVVFLQFGLYIIGLFSLIVLFYTNGFLMKRRKNEMGLFIILGMEKRHLGGVQFFESLIVGLVSIVSGIALGIGFSALTLKLLTRLTHINTPLQFTVDPKALIITLAVFLAIYFLIFLYNLVSVGRAKPIELLKGSAVGEKEPKSRWVLTIIGVLALGGGYAIALLVDNPLSAVLLFFVAVVLVIIGTYLLFTSGSVTILKSLRNNKNFYYKTNHFINVSGMIYRMKQNAVGLGNICILSTMVLVMVSTTVALNVGVEDILSKQYPGDIVYSYGAPEEGLTEEALTAIEDYAAAQGTGIEALDYNRLLSVVGSMDGSEFRYDPYSSDEPELYVMTIISASEYTRKTGEPCALRGGEALISFGDMAARDNMSFMSFDFSRVGEAKDYPVENLEEGYGSGYLRLVVSDGDFEGISLACKNSDEIYADDVLQLYFNVPGLDMESSTEFAYALYDHLNDELGEVYLHEDGYEANASYSYASMRDRASEAENIYSMYGGFLFLGISLGIMFMMATILIIYYKQITEGYNDRERFIIMQKVGLSKDEIKKSIRSQIVMVFFIPLIAAVIHVTVAFNIIKQLLAVLYLTDVALYLLCTAATIAVYAIVYFVIYTLTAREYYKIVSR